MPRVTVTLPTTDEPVGEQLLRILGDLPVLPSGEWNSHTITLTADRAHLVAAIYLIHLPDYMRAHEVAATIEEVR
jgi:hypothetical protein